MCFSAPKIPTPTAGAPPPAPPANAPTAPVLNTATAQAASGADNSNATMRGVNALRINLANPGGAGSGLTIPQ